ncbi:conserved hypothetical protein [Acinetobacter phage Ac42]|uniref:arabinose 5-phosphate isomerase n=1 Tax=Acinetobacter phage Ac42 TaxID=762660 RepID=UPI0001EBCCEE|nr:arabinose 5-phosphate isomerase [Acinetobacter phage Ac42]ADI96322.1 conserved hypothetical protein [Acinetobacter phage Ac42]
MLVQNAKAVIEEQIRCMNNLSVFLDENSEKYEQMMDSILNTVFGSRMYSNRVVITGVGKNANLAAKASETFASLGVPSLYLNTCHYAHGDAGFIGYSDVVIHVSRSGKTEEMQGMARHLRGIRPEVKQILLSCNDNLPEEMKEPFDFVMNVPGVVECDENKLAPTSSTTVLLALLDTIGINLSKEIGFTRQDFLTYHPGGSLGQMIRENRSTI